MTTREISLDSIASSLLGVMPDWNEEQQSLAIHLYRILAQGEPVSPGQLAEAAGIPLESVSAILEAWKGGFQYENDEGQIVGSLGLALSETPHRFELKGRTLFTWCAWDSLFIPGIINETARVESPCPVTRSTIRLTIAPHRVMELEPAEAVMSFLIPDAAAVNKNIMGSFCHFVHFFSSSEAGEEWISQREGMMLLSVVDAFELGQRFTAAMYGDLVAQ